MVKRARKTVWDKEPVAYLKAAVKFIRKDSPQNAMLVKKEIVSAISELPGNPTKHGVDKYRVTMMARIERLKFIGFVLLILCQKMK